MHLTPCLLPDWAEPVPAMGKAAYRVTDGPKEHKHAYHLFCPWSPDGTKLVLFRYDRQDPQGDVCVLDLASRALTVVGRTGNWTTHSGAVQQWQGDRARVLYHEDGGIALVAPDGTDARHYRTPAQTLRSSSDGRYVFAGTPPEALFPDDRVADRTDKGLVRLDLDTGETKLLVSVQDALDLHPERDRISDFHLYIKMMIPHPRRERVLFHFVNSIWDRGLGEERVRCLYTCGFHGEGLTYLGRSVHHPNWHPVDNVALVNLRDFNEVLRFGLYRGDGGGLVDYVPGFQGSGHPSHSPDGRYICTDRYGDLDGVYTVRVVLCDLQTGIEHEAARFPYVGGGYASYKAVDERPAGRTVAEALAGASETWQTQAHPAWSRDGRLIMFNCDDGHGSQLYAADVAAALAT